MCGIHDAKQLIKEAKQLELSDPTRARQKYLEAAEIFLITTTTDKKNEKRLVELAKKCYSAAEQIKTPGQLRTIAIDIPKDLEKDYAKHAHDHSHTQDSTSTQISIDKQETSPSSDSKITFASIGGLEELKDEIRLKIIDPLMHPEVFKYFGKKIGGGILMYGPPGCGKSLIAEAAANEAGASFFNVKASDLKSKYVGETEKNIAELFEKARKAEPSIIFFDEFESLGGDRTGAPAHEKSSVAELLTQMDGVGNKNQQILLLAATNEPWSVDSALRREGRFGNSIFVPPPDKKARHAILMLKLKDKPLDHTVNVAKIVTRCENYSGADLIALCEEATNIPLREYFKTKKLRPLGQADLDEGLLKINSVMIPWFAKARQQIKAMHLEESFKPLHDLANSIAAEHDSMNGGVQSIPSDEIVSSS